MSGSSGDWYLTHGDGEVHGPFDLAALVDAARRGNVLPGTQLRSEAHTGGQWLPAIRLKPLAEVFHAKSQPDPNVKAAAAQPKPVQPQPDPAKSAPQPATPSVSPVAKPAPQAAVPLAAQNPPAQVPVASPVAASPVESAAAAPSGEMAVDVKKHSKVSALRRSLTIPESVGEACLALFDFRFRYFITPWIIKFTWAVSVVIASIMLLFAIVGLIMQPTPGGNVQQDVDVSFTVDGVPQTQTSGNWEFNPPSALSENLAMFVLYSITVMTYVFGLLYIRVGLELAIVLFRIAIDLGDIKEAMQEE